MYGTGGLRNDNKKAITVLKNRASTGHPKDNWSDFSFGAPIQTVNEALDMAIAALRTQKERENPKPLTLDELREMDGEPVWVTCFDGSYGHWAIVHRDSLGVHADDGDTSCWFGHPQGFRAYCHKPPKKKGGGSK